MILSLRAPQGPHQTDIGAFTNDENNDENRRVVVFFKTNSTEHLATVPCVHDMVHIVSPFGLVGVGISVGQVVWDGLGIFRVDFFAEKKCVA